MKIIHIENYTAIIGQNSQENWKILSSAKQKYTLFHLSKFPSCYLILQTEDTVNPDILNKCAQLCLQHTKYKNQKNIKVDYTLINNIIKGDIVGEYEYKSNKKVNTITL